MDERARDRGKDTKAEAAYRYRPRAIQTWLVCARGRAAYTLTYAFRHIANNHLSRLHTLFSWLLSVLFFHSLRHRILCVLCWVFLCVFGVCSIISYRYKLHVTVQQIGMIEWMEWKQSTLWPNPKFQAIIHMAFLFALAFRFDFARTAAYGGQCAVFLLFFLFLIVSICCSNKKNRNT